LAAGLCPDPLGELKRSPNPLSRNMGPTSKGEGALGTMAYLRGTWVSAPLAIWKKLPFMLLRLWSICEQLRIFETVQAHKIRRWQAYMDWQYQNDAGDVWREVHQVLEKWNKIDASGGNMKKLWRTLNGVLGKATVPQAEELQLITLQRSSDTKLRTSAQPQLLRCCTMFRTGRRRRLMSGMLSPSTRSRSWSAEHRVRIVSSIRPQPGLSRICVDYCHHLLLCCLTSHYLLAAFQLRLN